MKPPIIRDRWRPTGDRSRFVRAALGLLDVARPLTRAAGIDHAQLRTLVALRLQLDLERNPLASTAAGTAASSSADKAATAAGLGLVLLLVWVQGLVPLFLGLAVRKDAVFWMLVSQSWLMALVVLVFLGQLEHVLVDATDLSLVGARPVTDRTLFAARIAHLSLYLGLVVACYACLPSVLALAAVPWWQALVLHPLSCVLSAVLAVGLLCGLYAIALRLGGPERFRRLTLAIQIGALALVMASFQFAQVFFSRRAAEALDTWNPALSWFPPAWYAAALRWLAGQGQPGDAWLTLLAFSAPVVAGLAVLRFGSGQFMSALAAPREQGRVERDPWKGGWLAPLTRRLARSPVELAGIEWGTLHARRERHFLRAFWPQVAILGAVVTSQMIMFRRLADSRIERLLERGQATPDGESPIFMLWLVCLLVSVAATVARYGDNAEARWVLQSSPLGDPRMLVSGAIRGVLGGSVVPALLGIGLLATFFVHPSQRLEALAGFEWTASLCLLGLHALAWQFPMSEPPRPSKFDGRSLLLMVLGVVAWGLGSGLVALARGLPHGMAIAAVAGALPLAASWMLLGRLRAAPD